MTEQERVLRGCSVGVLRQTRARAQSKVHQFEAFVAHAPETAVYRLELAEWQGILKHCEAEIERRHQETRRLNAARDAKPGLKEALEAVLDAAERRADADLHAPIAFVREWMAKNYNGRQAAIDADILSDGGKEG